MGSRQQNVRVTRLGRFVRGRRPDRNPLRRASDRLETAVLALLVITFLIAAPFAALAVGSWTLARAQQAQFAEQASSYHVPAQVLKLDAPSSGAYGDPRAQARWTAHNGTVITGDITVPLGTAAGSTQQLWTTADGQVTNPPLEDSQVTGQAYFAEAYHRLYPRGPADHHRPGDPLDAGQTPDGRLGRGMAGNRIALDDPGMIGDKRPGKEETGPLILASHWAYDWEFSRLKLNPEPGGGATANTSPAACSSAARSRPAAPRASNPTDTYCAVPMAISASSTAQPVSAASSSPGFSASSEASGNQVLNRFLCTTVHPAPGASLLACAP